QVLQLRERALQVFLDIVAESLQRRDIEDLGGVGEIAALLEKGIDGPQEAGQSLPRPRGRGDEGVAPLPDEGPAHLLGKGGFAEPSGEPAPEGGMERVQMHESFSASDRNYSRSAPEAGAGMALRRR